MTLVRVLRARAILSRTDVNRNRKQHEKHQNGIADEIKSDNSETFENRDGEHKMPKFNGGKTILHIRF